MGMTPKRRTVNAAWLAKPKMTGDEIEDYYRARKLEKRMANRIFFEDDMGGDYYSPGPLKDMAHYFWQQSERQKKRNRLMGLRR
jgi:hypothetical protein